MDTLQNEINCYWSNRAESYSEVNQSELQGRQHLAWQKLISQTIEKYLASKSVNEISVLDMGTGPGFFAIVLAELGYKVTAYDANHEMLEQAKLNAKALAQQIKFDQGDAQEVTYADNSFDVVISRNLTWILPQPEIAYKEWCRVLKPHGLLINFDANWYNYLYDEEKKAAFEQDRIKVAEKNYEDHYLTTDMETMERLALQVPLSAIIRPDWDINVLQKYGMHNIKVNTEINEIVLSEVEKLNYASTPYFMITAFKELSL